MSPNTEQELLSKVNEIHTLLTGGLDKESGLITRVNRQDRRISTLERWRWYVLGGFGVVMAYLRFTRVI